METGNFTGAGEPTCNRAGGAGQIDHDGTLHHRRRQRLMNDPGENLRLFSVFILGVSVGILSMIVWLSL